MLWRWFKFIIDFMTIAQFHISELLFVYIKWWMVADISWQRTKSLMLASNNVKHWVKHCKIIVTQEFIVCYESAKHLGDVARERTLLYFFVTTSFFLLVPLSLSAPPLYTVAHFSDIIARVFSFASIRDWRTRKSKK